MKYIEKYDLDDYYDNLILFVSHEERSIKLAKYIRNSKPFRKIYTLYNTDLVTSEVENNMRYIQNKFSKKCSLIPVSLESPIPIIRAARKLNLDGKNIIDITGFNRGNLFPFLWATLIGKTKFPELTFAYTTPKKYGTWLTRDYDQPKNLIGYSGDLEFAQDRFLICLVGYEIERAINVIKAAEPSKVILTVGTIPTKREFYERNLETIKIIHGHQPHEICEIDVSDPQQGYEDLFNIYDKIDNRTALHIAPFNTKLSCLSVWSLWLRDDSIRIWNSQPVTYNLKSYSKGTESVRFFMVDWSK